MLTLEHKVKVALYLLVIYSGLCLTRKTRVDSISVSNREPDLSRYPRELRIEPSGLEPWPSAHCKPVTTSKCPLVGADDTASRDLSNAHLKRNDLAGLSRSLSGSTLVSNHTPQTEAVCHKASHN